MLLNWLAPKYDGGLIWPLVLGLLLYTFLRAIPLGFGYLVGVVVTLVGIGAIWLLIRDCGLFRKSVKEERPAE